MVVAVVQVRMMQTPVNQIIDVISVGHGFVSASRAMRMRAFDVRSAGIRIS